MSTSRKSYTFAFKQQLLEEATVTSLTAVANKYNIDARTLRRWRKIDLDEENPDARRKKGGGRKLTIPDLEDAIFEWILDRRIQCLPVSRRNIQEFALRLYTPDLTPSCGFKASNSWLRNFMDRYELSLRRSTTLYRLEDLDVINRTVSFRDFVDSIDYTKYDPRYVIAMDETAVYYGNSQQTTIEQRGTSAVRVPSTGYESARVTCILGIRATGEKLPPCIISKGIKAGIESRDGVILIQSEKAWSTQAVIKCWIEYMFPLVLMGTSRGLLFWDSASTHRANSMKEFLRSRRIDQVMIPAGMTSYLQSLDIVINKPFKDVLRKEINDYIEHRMQRNVRGNFIKPLLSEAAKWVNNAWNKITPGMVRCALISGYIGAGADFSQTYIGSHYMFGPLIAARARTVDSQRYSDTDPDDELLIDDE